jgi:ABC-type phosphate/phosphonate transport system substrate-binding protein
MSLVANARMYAVTPAAQAAWQALIAWVARHSGVALAYVDHAAPAPLEALWARRDLGAAFMCGFPFASAAPQPRLLAAPVPSPPRYRGQATYCTDLIVRADRPFGRLADTFGGRIGWTVGHSQSGYNAVRHHLLAQGSAAHYQWVGPLVTPRRVIDAVLDGTIDVGPLDSYVHDLTRHHDPQRAAQFRVIESTAMTPIPPLIAAANIDESVAARLRDALLSCHDAPELAATREALLLARFAPVEAADYRLLVAWEREADTRGVAAPASSGR